MRGFKTVVCTVLLLNFVSNASGAAEKETLFEQVLYRVGAATSLLPQLAYTVAQYRGGYLVKHALCLQGHTDTVRAVLDIGNDHIASASDDKTVRVWNRQSGECAKVLQHDARVSCLALVAGLLATGSDDAKVRLWQRGSDECPNTLENHTAPVRCLAALPKGLLASGSDDMTIQVCNSVTGECIRTLTHHNGPVTCLAVSPQGMLASGSQDTTVWVHNPLTGQCLQNFEYHSDPVREVLFMSDGALVSSSRKAVFLSNVQVGEYLQRLRPYQGEIEHMYNQEQLDRQESYHRHDLFALYLPSEGWVHAFHIKSGKRCQSWTPTNPTKGPKYFITKLPDGRDVRFYIQGNHQESFVDRITKLPDDSLVWGNNHNKTLSVFQDGQAEYNMASSLRSGSCIQELSGFEGLSCISALSDGGLVCGMQAGADCALELFSPEIPPMPDGKMFAAGVKNYRLKEARKKKNGDCVIS